LRYAQKHLGKEVRNFTKLLDEQMGVKVFMLLGYKDEAGDIVRSKSVYIPPFQLSYSIPFRAETQGPASDRFNHTFEAHGKKVWDKWDQHLMNNWKGQTVRSITCQASHFVSEIEGEGSEDGSDDKEEKKPLRYDKSLPYQLGSNGDGWPILPGQKDLRLSKLKDLIRSFITMTYRTWKNNYRNVISQNHQDVLPTTNMLLCLGQSLQKILINILIRMIPQKELPSKTLPSCVSRSYRQSIPCGSTDKSRASLHFNSRMCCQNTGGKHPFHQRGKARPKLLRNM